MRGNQGAAGTGQALGPLSEAEIEAAHRQASPEFLAAVRRIRDNVLEFQRAILHRDVELQRPAGVRLRQRYVPLRRIGVCVPGGAAEDRDEPGDRRGRTRRAGRLRAVAVSAGSPVPPGTAVAASRSYPMQASRPASRARW